MKSLPERLRERLVVVPKPGTEKRKLCHGESFTMMTGGTPKAGDSAGECQIQNFYAVAGCAGMVPQDIWVQEHVYAVDPLCEEAALALERHNETDAQR